MVKEQRQMKGITQVELAGILQVTPTYVNKLENGKKKLTLKLAARIAKILDCSISDLQDSRYFSHK